MASSNKILGRCLQGMLLIFTTLILTGCAGSGDDKPEVQGKVTWNGQPIEQGSIEVESADGSGQIEGAEIKNGAFTINTTPGNKKVRVRATRQTGMTKGDERVPPEPILFQYLPEKFNDKTELTHTISPSDLTMNLDLQGTERKPRR